MRLARAMMMVAVLKHEQVVNQVVAEWVASMVSMVEWGWLVFDCRFLTIRD